MSILRRFLGIFVMIAGVIGLLLSLAGLVGVWMVRPVLATSISSVITTLNSSIDTSKQAMVVTDDALGAAVGSVEALSEVLGATATSVKDTQPVITQVNGVMGETLPATFEAANDSLLAAGEAAKSLESAIKSLDAFRTVIGGVPLLSAFVPAGGQPYNPEKPLADSLGELADSMQGMPTTFEEISASMDKADDNLDLISSNMETMAVNVGLISNSLVEYRSMLGQSQASMDNLKAMLVNTQNNLDRIINTGSLVLGLFFLWLLAAQVVIFSQGLELFHGTATRMNVGESKPAEVKPASTED